MQGLYLLALSSGCLLRMFRRKLDDHTDYQPTSQCANVNLATIRYYERRGLIPEPPRRPSGYRVYSEASVARIQFIKSAQDLGFSLKEIKELLALRVDPNTTCADVKRQGEAKLAQIAEKICIFAGHPSATYAPDGSL